MKRRVCISVSEKGTDTPLEGNLKCGDNFAPSI